MSGESNVNRYAPSKIKDEVAVITGGVGGIGAECAKEILGRGGRVVLADARAFETFADIDLEQVDEDRVKAEPAYAALVEAAKNWNAVKSIGGDNVEYIQTDATAVEAILEKQIEDARGQDNEDLVKGLQKQLEKTKGVSVENLMRRAAEWAGSSDITMLVNAAGIQIQGPVKVPDEGQVEGRDYNGYNTFSKVIDINLKGSFNAMYAALPYMPRNSAVVNLSSVHGYVGSHDRVPYCASKHGVMGMSKSLAADLAVHHGVRINTVSPAFAETPLAIDGVKRLASDISAQEPYTEADRIPYDEIAVGGELYEKAKKQRLELQGGDWITLEQIAKETADLLEGKGVKTGEDMLLDKTGETAKGLAGYVQNAGEVMMGGLAVFKDEVLKALSDVNIAAKQSRGGRSQEA